MRFFSFGSSRPPYSSDLCGTDLFLKNPSAAEQENNMACDSDEEDDTVLDFSLKNSAGGVHIFDFKYSNGASPAELRNFVTNEIVKVFGNSPANSNKESQTSSQTKQDLNKSSNIQFATDTNHNVLKLNKVNQDVSQTSLNKQFVCILLQDGSVLRAECKTTDTSSSNLSTFSSSPVRRNNQELFQVASDESYAQSLQRTLNTLNDTVNLLSGRRSYLGRGPIQTFNNRNLGQGTSQMANQHRDVLQTNVVLSPSLHRLSPTLRGSRYMPYDRDSRSNRRHIQMGHLLNTPLSRTVMYSTDEEMTGTSIIPDNTQIDLLDNITMVALENGTPEGGIRLPNYPQPTINIEPYVPAQSSLGTEIESRSSDNSENIFNSDQSLPIFGECSVVDLSSIENMDLVSVNGRQSFTQNDSIGVLNSRKADSPKLSNSKLKKDVESSVSDKNNKMSWVSKVGDPIESGLTGEVIFTAIYAMESSFLLLDAAGVLWFWFNDESTPKKSTFTWNEKEKITFIGCNMFRATVVLESKGCVTFYDRAFCIRNGGTEPTLIKTLSHEPMYFNEIINEDIADVQCSTFFTVLQTITGKAFWWGLAPSSERNLNVKPSQYNSHANTEILVGDTVSLSKQDKNETGALVFNNITSQFGVVLGKMYDGDTRNESTIKKVDVRVFSEQLLDNEEDKVKPNAEVWECKDVVFLQDQHSFTGKVVSLDGPYAIVKHTETETDVTQLKVYFKASLEKVNSEQNCKTGRNRYQKHISLNPKEVFTNENFTIAAVAASELGITLLVIRTVDNKAFLMYPPCLNYHYSSWLTCGKSQIDENEVLTPDSNSTVEYEATPAYESNLCLAIEKRKPRFSEEQNICKQDRDIFNVSETDEELLSKAKSLQELDNGLNKQGRFPRFSRSFSMPTGHTSGEKNLKRKLVNGDDISHHDFDSTTLIRPKLFSIGNLHNQCTLMLDNKGCVYPFRFSCCLVNPPLLEICPMTSFILLERGRNKTDKILTVLAVPKKAPLTTAIKNGDVVAVKNLLSMGQVDENSKKKMKLDTMSDLNPVGNEIETKSMFGEYCNGNQNVMHIAVANIIKTSVKSPVQGNIMDVRNEEENAILQQLLNNPSTWLKIKTLLCERDSHGCTPFMSAIMMQNLRGAYLILEAIKRDGKNACKTAVPSDMNLFTKAICTPLFSGLTPLHALIQNSSKKSSSQQWFNTLKVSNLPPSYSPRLLLKLFKSRFPSVYRAIMPIPKPCWPKRSVREKAKVFEKKQPPETQSKKGKTKLNTPQRPPPYINIGPRYGVGAARYTINRADILRANAKEGLVMFGDLNEMYQAITEMNNHSLLMKNDHPSGALLSVVQHLLQVQHYQENLSDFVDSNALANDKPNTSDFNMESAAGSSASAAFKTIPTSQDLSSQSRVETISKCFDDIMVHWLVTSLITCDPSIATSANAEGDSALSYFIKTYPRYSPSHLHKLFLNWRPCNQTSCKYNRHVGKLSITSQIELDANAPSSNQEKKKPAKESAKKTLLHPDDATQSSSHFENPILARRGLQYRGNSLTLNVKSKSLQTDSVSSPVTPSIRILDNLKFAPIEVNASTGLTPQITHPFSAVDSLKDNAQGSTKSSNISPFFPQTIENTPQVNGSSSATPKRDLITCNCHRSKARLLWNTTFEASVFYLTKNWPCLVGTVMCYKPFPQIECSEIKLVESNKLDNFTENLLLNPYSILLEVFIKTLKIKFLESKISQNPSLLASLHSCNPTDQEIFRGKTFNCLLPWFTVQRFVRALVRQLSLSLSKNATLGANLKYKIGRHANKVHSKKETRLKDNLRLCLKAFSWISVLEILRAADAMLKPIRSGTVKAQSKGIIRDIQSGGQPLVRSTFPSGMRLHIPLNGTAQNQRTIIRSASRRSNRISASLPSNGSTMLSEDNPNPTASRDDESTSDVDDGIEINDQYSEHASQYGRSALHGVGWNQNQVITPQSTIAWAVDGHVNRRSEMSSRLPPPGLWQFNHQNQLQHQIMNTPSIHAGYLYLARMFCRLVKEATDLAASLSNNTQDYGPSQGTFLVKPLEFNNTVEETLMNEAQHVLDKSWKWMRNVLDMLEQQLTVGEEFDTKHFVLRLEKSSQEGDIAGLGRPSLIHLYGSTPDEYMMYLLKQDMGEAEDSLPVLDLLSYTHLTYILDAYLYMKKLKPFTKRKPDNGTPAESAAQMSVNMKFFKNTIDAEERFIDVKGVQKHVEEVKSVANHISSWLDGSISKKESRGNESSGSENEVSVEWNRTVDAFATLFLTEGPGYERDSFLAIKSGASGRMSRFQRSLAAVRGTDVVSRSSIAPSQAENPSLMINVGRSKLLNDCINIFSESMDLHPYGTLRVRFEGEEGTGPGVNRGLFAAFAKALKSGEKYKDWPVEFFVECGNLPTQRGVYSPKVGKYHYVEQPNVYFGYAMTQEKRYSTFVAIGRFFGITLWFNQTIPMVLSRPVLRYLLGRDDEIVFDDLAFFDSALYQSFSDLLMDAFSSKYTDEEFMDVYCFCFEITVDGHTEELMPGGKQTRVTKQNVLNYVRLYSRHLLITARENELQGLKDGLHQMIPKELLDRLEPEDLQLLLSGGVEDVSYARLRSIITFSNSGGCSREILERYKSWFWKIVLKMSSQERQKLLYFATGSSVLPALDNRVGNNEELSITLDIINSSNNLSLPMSSTCGQRISMPLYTSKAMLKRKLLQAIECQSYGLG